MGRKRKAVGSGITRQQPTRNCRGNSANVAGSTEAGEPGITMSANTRSKRYPRRGAAKSKWDEEKVMTSTKSPLVKADLVKLLASRKAWDLLEEPEKEEILSLLPDHVCTQAETSEDGTAKIPPLAESFVRYDNSWRDGVRQFQVDLENGRYDPEWIRQAEVAVQERAQGEFDNFKEREFEEFWGQKQKMDKSLSAGESSQVKLKILIEHGVICVGDVWKLSRGFNVPGGRILVEKEAKILAFNDSHMTCVVPAGQRVFLPQVPDADFRALLKAYKSTTSEEIDAKSEAIGAKEEDDNEAVIELDKEGRGEAEPRSSRKRKSEIEDGPRKKQQQEAPEEQSGFEVVIPVPMNQDLAQEENAESLKVESSGTDAEEKGASTTPQTTTKSENDVKLEADSDTAQPAFSLKGAELVILPNVNGPTYLGNKMIEVDGRIKHIPNGNAWKEIRCFRKNQDMGSLWEVRQAWYVKRK